MMNSKKLSISLLLCVMLVSMAASAAGKPSPDVVTVDTGSLKGAISNGVASFKGIPFAAPPLGDLRWRPPQPAQSWTGVRSAEAFAPDCLQVPFPSDAAPLSASLSEDCLYLNVWTPSARGKKPLPVMVWIYGGGFVNGGTSPAVYDGTHFAEDGIVFVSLNYRVGRFGFFAHPALSKENPGEPHGNYGYMDQIAAMKWVKRNIAAFGGDPGNVTVFGESAGGGSVFMLLTSPLAKGLFQKAVIESGGGRDHLMGPRYIGKTSAQGTPSGEEIGMNFAKSNGIEGTGPEALEALRKLPADKVVDGLNMATMGQAAQTHSGPMIDGQIVTQSPKSALLSGQWAKVPLMIGATSADIGFPKAKTMDELFAQFGSNADKAKALYNPENSDNVLLIGWKVAGDQMMVEPARFVARTVAEAGIPSFEFRFSYVAESLREKFKGALHATEIPYVFDTVKAAYGERLTASDEKMARETHAYWVSFAKTGDPAPSGLPRWPAYDPKKDVIMDFTLNGPVVAPDPWKARLDLAEATVPADSGKVSSQAGK